MLRYSLLLALAAVATATAQMEAPTPPIQEPIRPDTAPVRVNAGMERPMPVPHAPTQVVAANDERAAAPTIGPAPNAVTVDVTLNISPTTGVCPYTTNLSWSATNASVCQQTGAWNSAATVPASGSQTYDVNSSQASFTLTCSASSDSRTISWTNPTQNTDGTATVLSGNKLYHGTTQVNADAANPIVLAPATTSYVLTGLPAGSRYVAVSATSKAGVDSAKSAYANTSITLPTGTKTVTAGCTAPPPPKPPTAVTIGQTVWETLKSGGKLLVGRDVGRVDTGVKCNGTAPVIVQGDPNQYPTEYWVVQKKFVTLYAKPVSSYVVGNCAVG